MEHQNIGVCDLIVFPQCSQAIGIVVYSRKLNIFNFVLCIDGINTCLAIFDFIGQAGISFGHELQYHPPPY